MGGQSSKSEAKRTQHHTQTHSSGRRQRTDKRQTAGASSRKQPEHASRYQTQRPSPSPASSYSHEYYTTSTDTSENVYSGQPRTMDQNYAQDSGAARRSYIRKLSSASSGSIVSDVDDRFRQASLRSAQDRRLIEAEKILEEIAKEYAAKRAAGLVPTKPVPARTLLWEEMAKNSQTKTAKRGQCIFGRDTPHMCGCTSYKKKKIPGQENPGGICEGCNHGGPWHRLTGGSMMRSSRFTRSTVGSSIAHRTRGSSVLKSEARSASYEYDSDEDDEDEDEDDDEDIANEVARPYDFQSPVPRPLPPPPAILLSDRSSFLSSTSSFGFPSRLSSGTNSLGALLKAIQRYRQMGLAEDEIEARIRADFPPVPRQSSMVNSDASVTHI
ncbi:hypothetical protein Poli38472_001179 [Pythium oligandrum]|uniref:Uncharacterized protein n=1 Tax=Pythium oligandrum TaxID=41045 RepID=A0A8K1CVI2_PYTOL|nr:hypothetical protein Poli38472_001179 [Pythium oligandrum]|eukprot:TMW69023.1 hypothetical protein Poli38472_001179 [Pythium oligandrum]